MGWISTGDLPEIAKQLVDYSILESTFKHPVASYKP